MRISFLPSTQFRSVRIVGLCCIILVLLSCVAEAQSHTGLIHGVVIDASTRRPLAGATIQVVGREGMGTTADGDGRFRFSVPVGEYSLRTTYVGYTTVVTTDIVVSTGRPAQVTITLREEAVSMNGVVVQADYFSSGKNTNVVSSIGLQAEEIKRSPGSAMDMMRIMHILPGVASSNDYNNELLVRGGSPNENLTVMDHVEIPSTNHYPNEFNSGGPINMVNVDLIEDITFSTGGFGAQYGDKLSSAMDITIREGDRRRALATNVGFNMAGFSAVLEGGFAQERGSWLVSVRKSFLEVADEIVGLSSIGLTSIPRYWDAQWKVVYDLSNVHRIQFSGIYGDDRILFAGESDETRMEKAGMQDSVGVATVDFHSRQYAAGLSLRSLWSEHTYTVLTLAGIGNSYWSDVRMDYTARRFTADGRVSDTQVLNARHVFDEASNQSEGIFKLDGVTTPHPAHEIAFGAQVKFNLPFLATTSWDNDTARYDLDGNGDFEREVVTRGGYIDLALPTFDEQKLSAYLSDRIRLFDALHVTLGLRADHFTYSGKSVVSPRMSGSLRVLPSTSLNISYGEYSQTLAYPLYMDRRNTGVNRHLDNSHARHIVAGIEHIMDGGLKATVEVYEKSFRDLPVSEEFLHDDDPTFRSDRTLSIGEGTSRGVEFFLQKKLVDDFFGTISYSISETRWKDPRVHPRSEYYTAPYDYPQILTVVLGTVVHGLRTSLDSQPWFVRYPSYLLPFADNMEFGLRYRFSSGTPYTPRTYLSTEQHREGGLAWGTGTWVRTRDINGARHPDYQRLDLTWLSRWNLSSWNLALYLSVQNVLNTKNVAGIRYNDDGTRDTVYQWAFFPIAGLEIEF